VDALGTCPLGQVHLFSVSRERTYTVYRALIRQQLRTLAEHRRLLAGAGFSITGARSTLTQAPSDEPVDEPAEDGVLPGAGFVALQATARSPVA